MSKSVSKAFIVTGPTSGIGYKCAIALAEHGTVVLVGRNQQKLDDVAREINSKGQHAITVICDFAEPASVKAAAEKITKLNIKIAGLFNNAGIMLQTELKNSLGWDLTFATNHLGPFLFTELLISALPDDAHILFVASAIEDVERKPAKVMGMKGGRFISVKASARGEWEPGGCKIPGIDAYGTSKQCNLATAYVLARENPQLYINAYEPGINPDTGLGGGTAFQKFIFGQIITRLPPFSKYRNTPDQVAKVVTKILTSVPTESGVYYDGHGKHMTGSATVNKREFQNRVVSETRNFLKI